MERINRKTQFSQETKDTFKKVLNVSGINMYQLINKFYKQSKLRELLPEEVLIEVGKSLISVDASPKQVWPYFISILKRKSGEYFANTNVNANDKSVNIKLIGDIMRYVKNENTT